VSSGELTDSSTLAASLDYKHVSRGSGNKISFGISDRRKPLVALICNAPDAGSKNHDPAINYQTMMSVSKFCGGIG
jgi:hypothetical protein